MSNGSIVADKVILSKVFSEDFWFIVPEYQRSYVWQSDNIIELLDDLYYAFENKSDSDYFLGSLVLKSINKNDYKEYEILDGQQRLTTFFMIMACLRDLVDNKKHKQTISEKIYQEEDELQNIPSRSRITYKIRDKVETFIEEFIISENGTDLEDKLLYLKSSENTSISNMANAIIVIKEYLKDKENIVKFIGFIFNKALFIYVCTENTEDAFRLFTILNDRGIPLTNADILKSQNIGELSNEKEISKYAKMWEEIEGRYGENFDRFLQFIRIILIKEKARANLLDEFNQKIYKNNGKEILLNKGKDTFELINEYSEIYDNIIDLQDTELPNKYKNLITIMKIGLRSEEWIPAVMYYYKKFKENKLVEFLTLLEYKFTGDWVCGVTPTVRLEAITNILKAIEKTSIENIEILLNNKEIFKINEPYFKQVLNSDIYGKHYAKHILLKLEYLMGDNTVHLSGYKYISVEHVLPQNPSGNSKWVKAFSNEERYFWTNKIANLVLLSRKKNSSLSNLDFVDKKERYLKSRMDSFKSNKIFFEQNDSWDVLVLKERQADIIESLSRVNK